MSPGGLALLLFVAFLSRPALLKAHAAAECRPLGHDTADYGGAGPDPDTLLIQVVASSEREKVALVDIQPQLGRRGDPEANASSASGSRIAALPTDPPGALQVVGNSDADLSVLESAVAVNLVTVAAALTAFSLLRQRYPLVYSGRQEEVSEYLPFSLSTSLFGWMRNTLALSSEDVEKASTLDHAMLIQFCKLCMTILLAVGLPMVSILCPLHAFFGGHYAGQDRLSFVGFANVQKGSWVCYVHSVVLWAVVYGTMSLIYHAQENIFLPRRFAWLRNMPALRAKTVLVEAIPEQYCSDEALKAYFTKIFSKQQVDSVHVVKHTQPLVKLLRELDAREATLQYETLQWEKGGGQADERPTFLTFQSYKSRPRSKANHLMVEDNRFSHKCDSCGTVGTAYRSTGEDSYDLCGACAEEQTLHQPGARVDTINYYEDVVAELREQVAAARCQFVDGSSNSNDASVYSSSGFVTFTTRRDAVMALQVQYMQDESRMVASIPPEPADVIFSDLQVGMMQQKVYTTLGWALVAAVFWSFLPFVVSISAMTNLHQVESNVGFVKTLTTTYPTLAIILDGLLASVALTVFMDFLPTVLNLIFYSCFQLKSSNWIQLHLQTAYFWFLLIFVVLITALGGSLVNTLKAVLETPSSVPRLLAETLPVSTHFYMKYLVLQWATPAIGMLRIVQLMKFVLFRAIWGDEQAKLLSEPEDQDYYGIGARSARFAINMVIVLIFSSLSPIITIIGLVNFALNTLFFEYLFVFAETRKNDLGGVFWIRQLDHLQYGLFVYMLLQVGCLAQRGDGNLPWVLAMPAFVIWAVKFRRFKRLRWESLPFEEVAEAKEPAEGAATDDAATYQQPELSEEGGEQAMQKVRGRWSMIARMKDPIVKPLLDVFGVRKRRIAFRKK